MPYLKIMKKFTAQWRQGLSMLFKDRIRTELCSVRWGFKQHILPVWNRVREATSRRRILSPSTECSRFTDYL